MTEETSNEFATKTERTQPGLKMALELGPLLVFFFANTKGEWIAKTFPALNVLGGPIFIATAAFMAATAISLVASKIIMKTLPIMPLVSGVVVFVFGALTLYLHDAVFIKMKPTIINAMFGLILLGGLAFGKSLLGYVFDSAFKLDAEGWRKMTIRWGVFFLFLAALNEVVWRNVSTDTWVLFKVWGTMPITIVFTMAQMPLIIRHSIREPEGDGAG
ncbi:septation protein A [Pararhizobium mangrovi]|uniref:Inner membrane-spanning protein YciB n=1 Tax=Pararhizobium mangrovi TaxID=2590452 RepID=A0A506TZU0_9HYPH|nr:septation protein A [Pararhizobium mangrovi]TPW27030.1 septation protein A [Pararhizobium mangrovi]